jgi:glycosyltransferase involved in cell wall biosynthesis
MNNAEPIYLAIAIPVYNTQKSLPDLVSQLTEALDSLGRPYEIILVKDGSPDASWATSSDCSSVIRASTGSI